MSINIDSLHETIDYLGKLPYDWNHNGAQPFSPKLIDRCHKILDCLSYRPFIAPTACGSIQFEYEKDNGDYLEIEVFEDKVKMYTKTMIYLEGYQNIDQDYTPDDINQIVEDFYRVTNGKLSGYPIANNVCVGRVVVTKNCLDVGIVAESRAGQPTKIYSRFYWLCDDEYCPEYGAIDKVRWYDTGIDMTFRQWKQLAIDTKDAEGFYRYWRDKLPKRAVKPLPLGMGI